MSVEQAVQNLAGAGKQAEAEQVGQVPVLKDPHQRAEAAHLASKGLFIVERPLPKINEQQLAVPQAALTGAASRFSARGDGVSYVRSIFLARQDRLLSFFMAESLEAVRAVNEASLVPFASIEPAVELPGLITASTCWTAARSWPAP